MILVWLRSKSMQYIFLCVKLCVTLTNHWRQWNFLGGGLFWKKTFWTIILMFRIKLFAFLSKKYAIFSSVYSDEHFHLSSLDYISVTWTVRSWEQFSLFNSLVRSTVQFDEQFGLFNSLVGWPSHFGDQFSQLNTLDRWTVNVGVRFSLVNSTSFVWQFNQINSLVW